MKNKIKIKKYLPNEVVIVRDAVKKIKVKKSKLQTLTILTN
jgi:hypothetical protein